MERIRGNALIVEDDPDCGEMMLKALTRAGYGVRWIRSRDDAVVAMNQYLYDYIILDYAMPGMSIEDFVTFCQMKITNVILVSAVVDPAREAQRLKLSHWIAKPFTPDKLMEVMRGLSSGIRKAPQVS
jgi:DNA-binding response OmpR family regulator